MRSQLLDVAIFGALLGTAEGKAFRWSDNSPSWAPAQQTGAFNEVQFVDVPVPTAAPNPRELFKRQSSANTCGYYDNGAPLSCNVGNGCYTDNVNSVMGCCTSVTGSCYAYTTCMESAVQKTFAGTIDFDKTRVCVSAAYPYCVTALYTNSISSGYSMYLCGQSSGSTYILSYTAKATDVSTSSKPTFTPDVSTEKTTSKESSSTSTGTTGRGGAITTTSTPNPNPVPEPSSSAPVGAIVGGVIGGIAVIGLIALGFFFVLRRKSNANSPAPPPATDPAYAYAPAPNGGYPPVQQMAGGGTPVDTRASMAKPPLSSYDPSLASPAPNSPSPPYGFSPQPDQQYFVQQQQGAPMQQHTPPPPQMVNMQQQPMQQQAPPQAYQTYQPYQQPLHSVELPTTRGDGELREM